MTEMILKIAISASLYILGLGTGICAKILIDNYLEK